MQTGTQKVFNLIILDESGSMGSIKSPTILGFNEIVQTIKGIEQQYPNQEHFISFLSFNGLGRKTFLWNEPVKKLQEINTATYQPASSTPLFDAIGYSVCRLNAELNSLQDYHILVTIFTDGEENASVEFSGAHIKSLIEELKEKRWVFTYIGTDHDVTKVANSISINNTMMFDKSTRGLKDMFKKETNARMNYSKKINSKEDDLNDYYGKESK